MTIKTQGGKVITKDGKVSCSCCSQCCLYPADAVWDGKYAIEDLPDFFNAGGDPPSIYTKLPSFEFSEGGQFKWAYKAPDSEFRFGVIAPEPDGSQADDRYYFEARDRSSSCFSLTWYFGTVNEVTFISDLFADTYTISGPISGTVTRLTACTWVGDGLTLRHDSGFPSRQGESPGGDIVSFNSIGTFKWSVNGNLKQGFQNEPIGTYAGGFSVA
jgi:hypothetical protein